MIIEIREELFYKLVELMKHRNLSIYNELKEIKPLDTLATDNTLQHTIILNEGIGNHTVTTDTLAKARELKTQKVKQTIKETIKELLSKDISPSKYKVNKATGIAFITLNKYYQSILEEVKSGK